MAKRALPLLTGGLNDVARSDLIDNSQLQECLNYEITGDGILKKRTEQEVFDNELNTTLSTLFTEIISISEPYYFITDIDLTNSSFAYTLDSDFIILAFGITNAGNYELHTLYKVKIPSYDDNFITSWKNVAKYAVGGVETNLNTLLADSGVVYTEDSNIQFVNSSDRIIITDNVNNAHFVTIDNDGLFRAGKLGMPAPKNKARVYNIDEWDSSLFEEVSTNTRLSDLGLFQCTYTAVTKSGDESNPAPLSDTLDMQFFKIDANGADERWINKVSITGLSVPNISENDLEDLKYFKVYMRVIRYSAGEGIQTLDLTERFEIISKVKAVEDTGNNYTLTVEVAKGDTANYENDVAPVSKTAAALGGITMVGNVQTKINFPYEFKYYHPITVENKDNKHYVDAIVKIRLWDKSSTDSESYPIENFSVNDYITLNDSRINSEHIRLYDEDTTTPIMVCYNQGESTPNEYIDLYIKIPLLVAGSSHIVYLAWTDESNMSNYNGVTNSYNSLTQNDFTWKGNIGIHYGAFMFIGSDSFKRQQVWSNSRVRNTSSLIVTPQEFSDNDGQALNKANTNMNGTKTDIDSFVGYQSSIPALHSYNSTTKSSFATLGRLSYKTTNNIGKISYDITHVDGSGNNTSVIDLSKGFISATITIDLSELKNLVLEADENTRNAHFFVIQAGSIANRIILGLKGDGKLNQKFTWAIRKTTQNSGYDEFENLPVYYEDDTEIKTYNLFWSWDFNLLKTTLVLYDVQSNNFFINEGITANEITNLSENRYQNSNNNINAKDFREAVVNEIIFGKTQIGGTSRQEVPNNTYVDNIVLDRGEYISDLHRVYQLWNFQPMYENAIGYDWDITHNNNIDFDETKEIKYKSNRNMVKWTDVNGKAFPDLYFKKVREPIIKIMPAPSFLQFEYQNTFIIFTRNSINRFVLQGSASGWSGSSSSLIEEKQQYGLLAEKSLVRAGDALFWLSEVGVVKWDRDGLNLITKNIVDVPIKSSLIGYFVPLNNQYVLHDTLNQGTSYVYHIDRNAWTKFLGLDVKQSITLTGGSELENINLFLKSRANINPDSEEPEIQIHSYPTNTFTTDDSNIKTKNMFFEKGTLKRIKADYTGDSEEKPKNLQSIIENLVGLEKLYEVEADSNEWRGVPLGSNRGKSVTFQINNADTISSIMYELDIESEVKI